MWVAEQEEKMEMSSNERRLRSFGKDVATFWGPAEQGCCSASSLLFPMAKPSASPSSHYTS